MWFVMWFVMCGVVFTVVWSLLWCGLYCGALLKPADLDSELRFEQQGSGVTVG